MERVSNNQKQETRVLKDCKFVVTSDMQKILFTYFFVLLFLVNLAQDKSFNNWHIGYNNIISFNSSPPVISNNSGMYAYESCSSISDSLGNTLFYTNGTEVYNRINGQMPNGFGLNGSFSSSCGALIVPCPFNTKKYFIFTVDAQVGLINNPPSCGCLCYSVVDLNLNNGFGDITIKNSVLHNSMTEKIAGFWHMNDSTVWVVTHEWGSNNFLSYLVTSNGVNPIPVISSAGSIHNGGIQNINAAGQLKISNDGSKIACTKIYDNTLELFKFNNSNGVVSNPLNIFLNPNYNKTYGIEFSPNSNFL